MYHSSPGVGRAQSYMSGLVRLAFGAAILLGADQVLAQMSWFPANVPNSGQGAYCHDENRNRMVFIGRSSTYELDGNGWTLLATGFLGRPSGWFSGIAYDRTRRRVLCYDGVATWHWNGSVWTMAAFPPPGWSFLHVFAHTRRGTVMAFGGINYWNSSDLYEWDGARWNLVPATLKPPRLGDANASQVWLSCTYDARRDRVVLFGSAWYDWNNLRFSNLQSDLWEWDAANGWVNPPTSGTLALPCRTYFDSHRGQLIRLQGTPVQQAVWDGVSWSNLTAIPALPGTLSVGAFGAFHEDSGRYYAYASDLSGDFAYTHATNNPALFESLAPGCPGSLGEPTLRLTRNWTRAWVGGTLSVDLHNLPQSTGFVAIGWSNLQAGAFPLPLDLTPYGMPGCHARVATDLIVPVTGANQTATLTMPVPTNYVLLGVRLYQQGFALDPAANAAGLTAGNAVRVRIGGP